MVRFVIKMLRKHILANRCPSFVSCRNKANSIFYQFSEMATDEVKARFVFTFSENVSKALFVSRIFLLQQPSELMLCNENGPKEKCA